VNLSRSHIKHIVVNKPCTAEAVEKSDRMEKEASLALRRTVWEQCNPGTKSPALLGMCVKSPSNSILSLLI
jgi:hypothetical protein